MKLIPLFIFFLMAAPTEAQIIKGSVVVHGTTEPVIKAKIKIILGDGTALDADTKAKGDFEFVANKKVVQFITTRAGFHNDTVSFKGFLTNNHVIQLTEAPVFICTEPIGYKDEEKNPAFEHKIDGKATTNFIDSSGKKQGRWLLTQTDKYDRKSKYHYGQPMSVGNYKDDIKVGKWLLLAPNGKVRKTVFY